MCTHNGKLKICCGCSFLSPMIALCDFSLFPLESGYSASVFISHHLQFTWTGAVCHYDRSLRVCVWSYLCWFSLSSCCLRRVGRNLLLARAASMSSISRLLSSRMAERMRRLSSRSTVPSSCTYNIKGQTNRGHEDKHKC